MHRRAGHYQASTKATFSEGEIRHFGGRIHRTDEVHAQSSHRRQNADLTATTLSERINYRENCIFAGIDVRVDNQIKQLWEIKECR